MAMNTSKPAFIVATLIFFALYCIWAAFFLFIHFLAVQWVMDEFQLSLGKACLAVSPGLALYTAIRGYILVANIEKRLKNGE